MRFGVFIPMLLVGLGLTFTPFFRRHLARAVGRHRRDDAPGVGLLRLARPDAAAGVRVRRHHPDHGVHLHPPAAAVHPGRADHGDRHRRLPAIRLHGTVHRRCEPGARDPLPGLVRDPGRAGRLSNGTVLTTAVPPRAPARPGTRAIRRPAVEHPAAGHRRAAQDLPRRADRPSVRRGERGLRRRGRIHGAGRTVVPEEFAAALDELFRRFDQIADRHGLEKIKTIGDAYMAVAGAPVPMRSRWGGGLDGARILAEAGQVRWPSGDPIGCGSGSPPGRPSPGSSGIGSSPTTCGVTP